MGNGFRTRGWSLERKLFLTFTMLIVPALGGIVFYLLQVLTPSLRERREENLESRLTNIADELNSFSREYRSLAVSLARKGEFLRELVKNPDGAVFRDTAQEEQVIGKSLARELESFPSVVGAGLFFEPFAFDGKNDLRAFYAHWVPPLGQARRVELSQDLSSEQRNYRNTRWYRSLIPTGWTPSRHLYSDVTWTDPYRDPVTLVPMIGVLVAMYGDDAELIGLSSVNWNLDELTQVIDRSRPFPNSIAALFSANTKQFAAVAGLQGLNLQPIDSAEWMPQLLFNAPDDRFEMVARREKNGTPTRVYSRTLENGLIYSLIVPEADIFADVASLSNRLVGLCLLVMAASLLAGALLIRFLLRALNPLAEISREYADGSFSDTYRATGFDELSEIGESLRVLREGVLANDNYARSLADGCFPEYQLLSADGSRPAGLHLAAESLREFTEDLLRISCDVTNGATAKRLDASKFQGVWRETAHNLNRMIENYDSVISESLAVCREHHGGDVFARFQSSRPGTFGSLKIALNSMLDRFGATRNELTRELEATRVAHQEMKAALVMKSQLLSQVCEELGQAVKRSLKVCELCDTAVRSSKETREISEARDLCRQALETLGRIVEVNQLEEGKVKLCNAEFNLHSLMFDIKDILRLRTIHKRQELSLTIDPNVPEVVYGDMEVLRSILLAIGFLSIESTDDKGTLICRVQLGERMLDSYVVEFVISDSGGTNMDARRRGLISQIQGADGMSGTFDSELAPSLVIAMRLAELMGGALRYQPSMHQGAQCKLSVNLLDSALVIDELDRSLMPSHETIDVSDGIRPSILIVEDDIVCQRFVARLVERFGAQPTLVADGNEALAVLERHRFDAVLMDVTLPVLDGIETTRRIRAANAPYSHVPIIAITGRALNLNRSDESREGFNSYLLKPIDSQQLRTELERCGVFRAAAHSSRAAASAEADIA